MGFWNKKKESAPEEEKPEPEEAGGEAPQRAPRTRIEDIPGSVRVRRIVIGAAVLLTALVIAGPFVISERAVKAESEAAKASIPPVPESAQVAASAPVPQAPAAASAQVSGAAAPAANQVPAAPVAASPLPQAPAVAPVPGKAATDAKIAEQKAADDAAAKARAKAVAAENTRMKAVAEKKAADAKKAHEDELAAAIKAQQKKDQAKKEKAADASAPGTWVIPVGTFSKPENAKKAAATARAAGVPVSVTASGRVTAGPFKSKAAAEDAEARLAMAGVRSGGVRKAK